ncbi:hypothetical protein BpHYR1_042906 [Brachionus plicatilis]|uniref:Uncharacterized protein n=1 Tax=Brachionus plicatilis TaxID=10195 RepID=A0A3M7T4U9_BRAPC|nr:hypothetical protein BpHYR1_042906 [Brachionus plicatilis]
MKISFPKEVENIIGSLSGPTIMHGLKCTRKKIDYNDLYIDQEETQSIIDADQKDNDGNVLPKTPGYQPTNFNDVISQISPQDLKTPVLEDHLRFSESDPNEKELTEKESKKPLVELENKNDKTFESESVSSTTES